VIPFTSRNSLFLLALSYNQKLTHCPPDTFYLTNERGHGKSRVLFDFMATEAGGKVFEERLSYNVNYLGAYEVAIERQIAYGKQQLDILDGLEIREVVPNPGSGSLHLSAGKEAIKEKVQINQFWKQVMVSEIVMSELALARVRMARKAGPILEPHWETGATISNEGMEKVQDCFGKFQGIRDEEMDVYVQIMKMLGNGAALSLMTQRHRNELWDLWQAIPGPPMIEYDFKERSKMSKSA
jgi:hypothetical protein